MKLGLRFLWLLDGGPDLGFSRATWFESPGDTKEKFLEISYYQLKFLAKKKQRGIEVLKAM